MSGGYRAWSKVRDSGSRPEVVRRFKSGPPHCMDTLKLYWQDPYMRAFTARVIEIKDDYIVLDQTAFYPGGGGQIYDTGRIEDLIIFEVKKDNEIIYHRFKGTPKFSIGDKIKGEIDWERRYRIMKNHSASHIVYYFMLKVYGEKIKPYGSGLVDEIKDRQDYIVDDSFDVEKIRDVENLANEFIEKGYEIKTWTDENGIRHWVSGEISMKCAGTHVKNTKEIGEIKIERGKKPGRGKERIETFTS